MSNKYPYSYIYNYIFESGDKLITAEGNYVNTRIELEIKCKYCPEIFLSTFKDYQQGKRHTLCKNKDLRDEEYLNKRNPRTARPPNVTKDVICEICGNSFKQKRTKQKLCDNICRKKLEQNRKDKGYYGQIGRKGGLISASVQIRRSVNEIYFYFLCERYFSEVINNAPIFDNWDADIILIKEKIAILWNGPWHYKNNIKKGHSLKQVQTRDKIKEDIIHKNGYIVYIIKDMGSKNKKFVEEEFTKFLTHFGYDINTHKTDDLDEYWRRAKNYDKPPNSKFEIILPENPVNPQTKINIQTCIFPEFLQNDEEIILPPVLDLTKITFS